MTNLSEAAEAVVTLCTDLGIERVHSPLCLWEPTAIDVSGVCRTCVVGAIALARDYEVISEDEDKALMEEAANIFTSRNDTCVSMRTVPDTAAMFALIREAGQRG